MISICHSQSKSLPWGVTEYIKVVGMISEAEKPNTKLNISQILPKTHGFSKIFDGHPDHNHIRQFLIKPNHIRKFGSPDPTIEATHPYQVTICRVTTHEIPQSDSVFDSLSNDVSYSRISYSVLKIIVKNLRKMAHFLFISRFRIRAIVTSSKIR